MSKDRKYETLSLEDLGEDERLVLEIVMREGACLLYTSDAADE